jgi:ABC-type phosphonate transport system ATPase subunit
MRTQEFIPKDEGRDAIIEVVKLTKKFGDVTVVDKISFALSRGELFGFLGPNGAEKQRPSTCSPAYLRPIREPFESLDRSARKIQKESSI